MRIVVVIPTYWGRKKEIGIEELIFDDLPEGLDLTIGLKVCRAWYRYVLSLTGHT